MDILIKAGQLLLGLSILVIIHELGHFMAARAFGLKVEKFYLFMDINNIKLFSFKRGDTEYGVGWLPLGGYVKIAGMIDESMDKDFVNKPAEPWEFRSKPVWQRMIVIMGGIIMNVVLGIIIFTCYAWHYGESYYPASEMKYGIAATSPLSREVGLQTGDRIISINNKPVTKVQEIETNNTFLLEKHINMHIERNGVPMDITMPDDFSKKVLALKEAFVEPRFTFMVGQIIAKSNAEKAGLASGDSITAINGQKITFFDELSASLKSHKGQSINLGIKRKGALVTLPAQVDTTGKIGFAPVNSMKPAFEHFTFSESFNKGTNRAWHAVADNVIALKRMITRDLPSNSIHSLIGIANFYGPTWDWERFWALTGMLSMVLAFMNLLPIPALDGGYLIFLIAELFRGKPVSYKVLEVAQMMGIGLIVLLMGYAFYNDITQFIIK